MTLPIFKLKDNNGRKFKIDITNEGAEIDGIFLQKKDILNIASTLRTIENLPQIGEAPNLRLNDFTLGRDLTTFKITTTGPSKYNININGKPYPFVYDSKIKREYVFCIEFAEQFSEIILQVLYQTENQKPLLAKSTIENPPSN
jgi:hypothetical protein